MSCGEGAGVAAEPGAAAGDAAAVRGVEPLVAPFEEITGEVMETGGVRVEFSDGSQAGEWIAVALHVSAVFSAVGAGFFSGKISGSVRPRPGRAPDILHWRRRALVAGRCAGFFGDSCSQAPCRIGRKAVTLCGTKCALNSLAMSQPG